MAKVKVAFLPTSKVASLVVRADVIGSAKGSLWMEDTDSITNDVCHELRR